MTVDGPRRRAGRPIVRRAGKRRPRKDPRRLTFPAQHDPARSFDRPFDRFLTALRHAGCEYRLSPEPPPERGELAFARCAACGDNAAYLSLKITENEEGAPITVRCELGCSEADIRDALARRLAERGLFAAAADVVSGEVGS
jgi:hypothetical protein